MGIWTVMHLNEFPGCCSCGQRRNQYEHTASHYYSLKRGPSVQSLQASCSKFHGSEDQKG